MKLFILVFALLALSCSQNLPSAANTTAARDDRAEKLSKHKDAIAKFFKPMAVKEGDWLDSQKESGESFEEYIASNPTLPTAERRTIYIQPIGNFTAEQKRTIQLTADYMKAFYNLRVELNSEKPLGKVPEEMQRRIDRDGRNRQIRTSYFLDDILPQMLPDDAAALIAFTNFDLYPEETWHFVFGQASLEKRIGVWSLYRLSIEADRDLLLNRTLKIAMHEVGHMFSMKHCTKYECLMSGTNHLAETDRRPLDNCPECMAKLAWAMKYDPVERYNNLAAFWQRNNRPADEKLMIEMANAIRTAEN